MSSNYSVSLLGPAPWGFRLQGGKDFNMPLTISRLTEAGKAQKAKISVGDVVLSIDGIATDGMNHLEAQNKIKACAGNLNLTLQKVSSVPKPASVSKDGPSEIIKPVPISHLPPLPLPAEPHFSSSSVGSGHNKSARPFGGGGQAAHPNAWASAVASIPSPSSAFTPASSAHTPSYSPPWASPGSRPSPGHVGLLPASSPTSSSSSSSSSPAKVSAGPPPSLPVVPQPSVYNTPINLYSTENACEVAMGQRRGLLESQGDGLHLNGGPQSILKTPRKAMVDTDIGFYHVPSHGDASRKRIIQDTEDWHPRTGTSQSRSFRILAQITGTENEPVSPESETEKKTNEEEESEPTAHTTCTVKTMVKGPGGSPANGKSAPKPSKAVVSAGGGQRSLVTPAGPAADRPVPRPHPKDEDSLVQRAEHIPAGTRTPMCAHCSTVIRGPFLVAMGKTWHSEEFNCSHCRTSLADIGFVEEQGSVFCEHCYEEFLAPSCGRCQQKILGEVINALKRSWHVYCFLCASCQQPIRNDTFHLEDGEPYCERDYYSLFGTSCHGCEFPVEAGDKFLEALGFTWHDTCFVCSVCCASLEGQTFFSKKDKPLCKKHAHAVRI
uniref:PDZ and LIM domain protein 5 n=1 Tax=Denticeps clupeoides TaxID=299321 RepID=A0AAY4CG18_9TELE